MSETTSEQPEQAPEKCTICGGDFTNWPNHLVVISNSNKTSMLFMQLVKNDPSGPEMKTVPIPICVPCIQKVVGKAATTQAAVESISGSETESDTATVEYN